MMKAHAEQSMSPGSKLLGKRLILTDPAPGWLQIAQQDRS
jgi:hypothetical protein